jgi:hypothetical protein
MSKYSISVVFIVKNAISQGYCFWESLESCLPFADEIIISEGYSTDKTRIYLRRFMDTYSIRVPMLMYQSKWSEKSYHGEAITKVSEEAISRATKDWVYYLQADEIIPPETAEYIKHFADNDGFSSEDSGGYNSLALPYYHFLRSWSPSKEGYKNAIRMVKNGCGKLKGDAWTFTGDDIVPTYDSFCPKPIYHFAWVFPSSNDIKDIEHAKLYENLPEYQDKMKEACKRLHEEKHPYELTDFDDFPELARRFVGKAEYELPESVK